jgi:hypothetical protein
VETLQAGEQSDWFDGAKERLRTVAFLKMVIGDTRAQVVDMVKADVAGKPLEKPGQLVIRAPLKRRPLVVPLTAAFPVDAFELVLDIE